MYDFLSEIDPKYSNIISSNDELRVTRALEVFYETKKYFLFSQKEKGNNSFYF